ncbi:MAG TPA: VOC family protein [Myxococcus sp.]|nr:VOC family protein [Myxococcus sp.]
MARKIFVNLPVESLERSTAFFKQLGFTFNAQFTDKNATCMVITEDIYVMLLVRDFFRTFTQKEVANATRVTESIVALTADSRAQVDELFQKAIAAGATETKEAQDHGFMYVRSFQDPDGHQWEFFWMDPSFVQK